MPFQDYWRDGDRYVVPGDAALLVGDGVLDRELFNVTGLVRQRYDDAHTDAVPLLVEHADTRALASRSAGASVRRELPELNLTALDQLPMHGDAAGRPRQVNPFSAATGTITVHRDGQLLGEAPVTEFAEYPVPDQDSSYEVVARAQQSDTTWTLSTAVSAKWTFRSSSAGEGKALPMLTARFDPAVNPHNQAPGDRPFSFPVHVERQDGPARITSLSVDVSYDDGATWRPAQTRRDHDRWTVTVRHPREGYASLRARVTDADGNRLEQTIVRAYQIR